MKLVDTNLARSAERSFTEIGRDKMKTKQRFVSIMLIGAFTASTAFAQNPVAPEVLPKTRQPFSDAKTEGSKFSFVSMVLKSRCSI